MSACLQLPEPGIARVRRWCLQRPEVPVPGDHEPGPDREGP